MTMERRVFVLQLGPQDFGDSTACLGPQIATVLESLTALPELSKSSWYAAGADAMGPSDFRAALEAYATDDAVLVTDMVEFLALVRGIGQFLDGVFFATPAGDAPEVIDRLTADGPSDKLVANEIVQVCAFDTAWIEIGSDARGIVESMRRRFGGKILQSPASV